LNAVELVNVDLGKLSHVVERHFVLLAVKLEQDFELQLAQLAVGDDEEVAAAAGRIEEADFGQLVVKLVQARGAAGGAVGLDALELGAEVVEEQGADDFEDVLLRRVVPADAPAFLAVHNRLEERAEDGGGDGFPTEGAAGQQAVAHVSVELGE